MNPFGIALFFLVYFSPLASSDTNLISYRLARGEISAACDLYSEWRDVQGRDDMEFLQHLGLKLLEQGKQSVDPEVQILTLFGAGVSGDDRALSVFEKGVLSNNPFLQDVAVRFLSQTHHQTAIEMLNMAMASPYLPVRLEALSGLIKNGSPKALPHLESLMQKLPSEAFFLFPELLIQQARPEAMRMLRQLLVSPDENTRVAAIIAIAKSGRDDLLPEVRRLSHHLGAAQQEACAWALGVFKDVSSSERLKELSRSSVASVRVAALCALYRLGDTSAVVEVGRLARDGELFALSALGEMAGSEKLLMQWVNDPDVNMRINAVTALLHLKQPLKAEWYRDILVKDDRDFVFIPVSSPGRTRLAWTAVPCAKQRFCDVPEIFGRSLQWREELLQEVSQLSEADFLSISRLLFETEQNDLMPLLTRLLAAAKTPQALAQLRLYSQKVGAPLIRHYCDLALYRAKEPGPHRAKLLAWIDEHRVDLLMRLKSPVLWSSQPSGFYDCISPEETSRLLVESIEVMVQQQDPDVFTCLLDLIRYGNPKNRYVLAGLLIRAAH